ncbi:hypothetical protein VbVaMValp1_05 [Vibrio phage Vb_VaM_Valp1]
MPSLPVQLSLPVHVEVNHYMVTPSVVHTHFKLFLKRLVNPLRNKASTWLALE